MGDSGQTGYPALAQSTAVPGGTQSVIVASQYTTLLGWSAVSLAIGAAQPGGSAGFRLHGFPSATGASLAITTIEIVTGSSTVHQWYGTRGIPTPSQLFLERTGGISEIVTYGY